MATRGIKLGTKLTEAPKLYTIRSRVDEKTMRKLKVVCSRTGKSVSLVIRRGIEIQYSMLEEE